MKNHLFTVIFAWISCFLPFNPVNLQVISSKLALNTWNITLLLFGFLGNTLWIVFISCFNVFRQAIISRSNLPTWLTGTNFIGFRKHGSWISMDYGQIFDNFSFFCFKNYTKKMKIIFFVCVLCRYFSFLLDTDVARWWLRAKIGLYVSVCRAPSLSRWQKREKWVWGRSSQSNFEYSN